MEARAITTCLEAVKGLQPQARQRVFAYVGNRYGMNIPWPALETTEPEAEIGRPELGRAAASR